MYDNVVNHELFIDIHNYITEFVEQYELIKLQIIQVNDEPLDFLKKNFDLEFVKCSYNGRKLVIPNIESLIDRESTIFPSLLLINYSSFNIIANRERKYKSSGFKVFKCEHYEQIKTCCSKQERDDLYIDLLVKLENQNNDNLVMFLSLFDNVMIWHAMRSDSYSLHLISA